jgi:glyoxylase-like metal-dependent hydrolase (beta-lactamase superfamily II)
MIAHMGLPNSMWLLTVLLLILQAPQPDGAGMRRGTLPVSWRPAGPTCEGIPDWQVQEYNSDFYILRESGCTNYEKPFLYLLFGKDRALLEDTGAGKPETAKIVDEVIAKWLKSNNRASIPLIVTHSHAHGDHIAGDAQFKERPNTTYIPLTVDDTQKAFHIAKWPDDLGQIDLGDRILDVIAIPGHEKLSLAFYDRQTGVLLTGDSVYPGRIYVSDFPEYRRSIQRLVDFTRGKIVTHLLGTHIEEANTPYLDYPVRTVYQPDEHPLALSRGVLLELNEALIDMHDKPVRFAMRDITIWPREPARRPNQ